MEEGFVNKEWVLPPLSIDGEPKVVMSYKEFKRLKGAVEIGTLVTGVKPGDLFLTQDWADAKKVFSAEERLRDDPGKAKIIPVYLAKFPDRIVMAAGDGTHRVITAKLNGDRVDTFIVGDLPPNVRLTTVSRFLRANSDLFQDSFQSK